MNMDEFDMEDGECFKDGRIRLAEKKDIDKLNVWNFMKRK